MKRWQEWGLLVIILLTAVSLRLTGIDWDDYQHYHPDERYITWVATTIEWPSSLRPALDPTKSSLNPFYWPPDAASEGIVVLQDQHRDFAYGHVPLYLGVAATRLMERIGPVLVGLFPAHWLLSRDLLNGVEGIEFRHLTAVSRALTGLIDAGTVLFVYWLGKYLYRPAVGLLAAAFLAVNVMHIQLAHFFISDPYLTFFVVAALFFMASGIRYQVTNDEGQMTNDRRRSRIYLFLAAVCVGLAVGSKFTAVLLLLPLAITVYIVGGEKWLWWLATAVFVVGLTFFITNPFAILDLTCVVVTPASSIGPIRIPTLDWRSCYLQDIVTQGTMVRGSNDVTFARQYSGTWPYLYFIEMQLRWGMGFLLGMAAFIGLAWEIWRGGKNWWNQPGESSATAPFPLPTAHLILLAWVIPFFVLTGSFYVKFMRYLQPITPFLMIYAAALLLAIRWRWLRWGAVTAVLLSSTLYALSFVNMYSQPHPWRLGSEWVYENVPPGALILSEQWDDALPSTMLVEGVPRLRSEYRHEELTWLTGADAADNEAKLRQNLARLAAGDYLTVMSNRVYGVAPRLPGRYPLSGQAHQLLFDGSLGYEPVYMATRMPHLSGLRLYADRFSWPGLQPPREVEFLLPNQPTLNLGRADESFTVYDQPLLIIFQNTGSLTAEEMWAFFELNEGQTPDQQP